MKRVLMFAAIVLMAALTLAGCDTVLGLIFEPNLSIEYVSIVFVNDEFAGVEFSVRNEGIGEEDVQYAIVLSEDQFADPFDTIVFEDDFDIDFKDDKDISVGLVRDIQPYIGELEVPPGNYFVGVIIDTDDDVDESDEDDA